LATTRALHHLEAADQALDRICNVAEAHCNRYVVLTSRLLGLQTR
jgi:RPA family protein